MSTAEGAADERKVEAVVRAYLDAIATGAPLAPHATGGLHRAAALFEGTATTLPRSDVEIKRLAVADVAGDEAVVDLEATAVTKRRRKRIEYRGPVHLRRVGGAWRVASFVRNGRVHEPRLLDDVPPNEREGVTVAPSVVELRTEGTHLWCRVQNRGAEEVRLVKVSIPGSVLRIEPPIRGIVGSPRPILPGHERVALAILVPQKPGKKKLRAALTFETTARRKLHFKLTLPIERQTTAHGAG